jgi:hypothetical protein
MATDTISSTRNGVGVMAWIFRALLVAGAAFMVYTWFQPWWSADVAVIKGPNDMVLHPWGVEAVAQVRSNTDTAQFDMPGFFAPLMWVYLGACMLALAASLFINRRIKLGPINLPIAMILIALVGLSYMSALGIAYGIGTLRSGWAGANFIGKSSILQAETGTKIKMVSQLELGFWLSLGAGGFLTLLALVRGLFVRTPK